MKDQKLNGMEWGEEKCQVKLFEIVTCLLSIPRLHLGYIWNMYALGRKLYEKKSNIKNINTV